MFSNKSIKIACDTPSSEREKEKEKKLSNLKSKVKKALLNHNKIVTRIWEIDYKLTAPREKQAAFNTKENKLLLEEKQKLEAILLDSHSDEKIKNVTSKIEKEFGDRCHVRSPFYYDK